jgi:hypothetical protein
VDGGGVGSVRGDGDVRRRCEGGERGVRGSDSYMRAYIKNKRQKLGGEKKNRTNRVKGKALSQLTGSI